MRLPWTLWLSMSIELWRLVLLTTVVLVAVVAFALAIKPLASGQLGPADAVMFMLVAMPPMLAYALPFASCFGATLAYHRMVTDNEVVAAHAAGLGHRAILAPAAFSGLLLAGVLIFLNAQVIPRFVRTMQEMVADDLARAIVTRIESGQPVERRDMILSAQTARVLDPSEMPGARSRVLLTGVAVLLLDEDRMPREELFARSAQVWVLPGGRDPETGEMPGQVVIQARDGFVRSRDGDEVFVESQARVIPLPNAFRDDPAFLTTQELDALEREPDRMNFIEWRRVDLAYHLAARAVLRRIAEDLRAGEGVRFQREGETIVVRAEGLREREGDAYYLRPMEASRRVEIEVRRPGPSGLPRLDTFEAHRAFLKVDLGEDWRSRELSLDLTMRNYAPTDIDTPGFDEQTAPIRHETEWTGLRLPGSPEQDLLAMPSAQLLEEARKWTADGSDPELAGTAEALSTRVDQLGREVGATRHGRAAMAASCLVMIIGGALAAMRMRGALPLAIYCWAFFPAIGALVTIAAGREMVHRSGMEWLVVLWGGVLAIAVLGAISFRSVART